MKTGKRPCWRPALFAAALLPVLGGCHRVSQINGEQVFQYELWAPASVLLAGLAVMPLGWALRNGAVRLGWSMIFLGPIAAGIVAPSMFRARVVVGADRFAVQNGVWASNLRTYKFADIDEIGLTTVTTLGRRGSKRVNHYLSCYDKAGKPTRVSIDNAVTKAAAPAILRQALVHGVRIRGGTRGRDW